MTDRRLDHVRAIALAVLLVGSLLGGVASVAGAATAQSNDKTASASLEIVQPHYVDSDVGEEVQNGTTMYVAKGERLRIYPQNFSTSNVVDAGIDPGNASFSRATTGTGYVLEPEQTGTYDLYWIVERPATGENATGTERVRYEATIRVEGQLNSVVVSQDRWQSTQDDAKKWQDVNGSVQQMMDESWIVGLLPGTPTAKSFVDSALRKQRLIHNPAAAFGEGLTLLVFGIFSLGGGLLFFLAVGWHAKAVAWLRRQLNIYESVESAEGDLARRFEESEISEAKRARQNQKFDDAFQPHVADAMRSLGETPYEADCNLVANSILPSTAVANKARAMGMDGYVGVLPSLSAADTDPDDDSGLATDGGAAALSTDEKIDRLETLDERMAIRPERDVDDDAVTVDLSKADRDWITVLPVNDDVMLEYEVSDEVDRSDIEMDLVDWEIEDIIQQSQLEQRHFQSAAEAGQHLVDFLEDTCRHPLTDPRGEPRTVRAVLETFLRDSQILDDRYNISRQHIIDVLQAAIRLDDPVEEGVEHVHDYEAGKYE